MKIEVGKKYRVMYPDKMEEVQVEEIRQFSDKVVVAFFPTWGTNSVLWTLEMKKFEKAMNPELPSLLPFIETSPTKYWHFFLLGENQEWEEYLGAKDKETAIAEIGLNKQYNELNDENISEHLEEVSEEIYNANK